MDKRHNNKKHSKNKHNNNKNKNTNNTNQNKAQAAAENIKPDKVPHTDRAAVQDIINDLLRQNVFNRSQSPKEDWEQYVKIQEALHRIQQLEAPLQRKRSLDNIDKFYEWAKENGCQYEGLKIQEFPNYDLGLVATRDIQKDELIFSIPRELILSEEYLKCDFIRDCFQLSNMRLAFTLMLEALNPNSFWKPYIDLLPEKYSTVLYYSVEEMSELKGSNALWAALKQCQVIAHLYTVIYTWPENMVPLEGFKEKFTYDLFRWAVSTVMTRENLIPRPGTQAGTVAALIPFWDMANHRDGVITSFFNAETQHMESKAQDNFKMGEQVFICYGDRSNANLMIHNGFINPQNPKDSVAIKLGLSTSDPLFEKRNELLQLLHIPTHSELNVLPPPVYISPELLGYVRVFNMNEQQLDHWIKSERAIDLLHIDCALETELESKTWQYLQVRLMLLLRSFPTSLTDDEGVLESSKDLDHVTQNSTNYIKMMILEYRVLEKRILAAALDYAKQRTKV